jgi:fatty-acyl-CoA synthase
VNDSLADQVETLGQPLPHVEVKIADPDTGKVARLGEIGEICVRGYQTMQGYYGEPEATAAAVKDDGWLHMGDLGTMDERGYLRIAGRLKDMVIRGGMNLFPREIEDVVALAPGVGQAAVIGVPDERWGEVIGAVLIPSDPNSPPSPDDVNGFCRQRLAAHKSPRHYYVIDAFPLTPSGKIQKFRLQEMIADGSLAALDWAPPAVDVS